MSESRCFQLLGTGAADANFGTPDGARLPPKDLRRYTCSYLSPNLLIDFNNHTWGALKAYGVDPMSIEHLFVSHGHYDHFQPMEILRFAASLPHTLKVYGNRMVVDALEFCRDNVFDEDSGRFVPRQAACNLETVELTLGHRIAVGGVRVTALLANHFMNKPYNIMEQQALNLLVEGGGRNLFYGLDSSYMMPRTLELLTGVHLDLAIMDATFGPREIDPATSGHHNWIMLDKTLAELRTAGCIDEETVVVAAHLSCCNVGPHDEVAAEQASKGIILAYDGLTLTF